MSRVGWRVEVVRTPERRDLQAPTGLGAVWFGASGGALALD